MWRGCKTTGFSDSDSSSNDSTDEDKEIESKKSRTPSTKDKETNKDISSDNSNNKESKVVISKKRKILKEEERGDTSNDCGDNNAPVVTAEAQGKRTLSEVPVTRMLMLHNRQWKRQWLLLTELQLFLSDESDSGTSNIDVSDVSSEEVSSSDKSVDDSSSNSETLPRWKN